MYTVPGSSCHNLAVDSVYCRDIQPLLQRALSPTAPVQSPTDETIAMTVRRAGRETLNRRSSGYPGAPDAMSTSFLCLSCIMTKYTRLWENSIQVLGNSRRCAPKDELHSVVPIIWCVSGWANTIIVFPCQHSYQRDVRDYSVFGEPWASWDVQNRLVKV